MSLKSNTAIAALMELLNEIAAEKAITADGLKTFLILLNPLAPHITEELWEQNDFGGYIHQQSWPEYDESKLADDVVEIAVQINGKLRGTVEIPADASDADAIAAAKGNEKIAAELAGKQIIKEIFVNLKAKGITPFGCAGKETWCVTEYLESIIEKSIGAEELNNVFVNGATWNNQGIADAVDTFQEMINKEYFDPAGIGLTNDEVKANFMDGKYAFYMNGTWNCADFAANDAFKDKVKVAEFPVIDSSKSKLGQLIGGPSDTLAVAASSPNADKAAEYAMELGKYICHYGYLDGCGLPAWTPYGDTSAVNPLTQTVADIVANADNMVLFGDTAMTADDASVYLDYVAQVYGSEIDGAGFIEGLASDLR